MSKKSDNISSYMLKAGKQPMEEQFLEVYDKNADAVFRFCYLRLFERELAKDFMQQTFLKTWEYLSQGKEVENLRAFVFKIARNLIIDYKRSKQESKVSLDDMLEIGIEPVVVDDNLDLKIDLKIVRKILGDLDEIYRESVTLKYLEGFRPKEIAEILGESEDVISVRIYRGLKKMKELIKKYEIY